VKVDAGGLRVGGCDGLRRRLVFRRGGRFHGVGWFVDGLACGDSGAKPVGVLQPFDIGEGELEAVEEEGRSFEVHAVAGETGGDVGDGDLDGFAGVEGGEFEGLVLDDGRDGFVAVLIAHVFVVHGEGAAAEAGFVEGVHALVGPGRLPPEVRNVGLGHGVPPVYTSDLLMLLELRVGSLGVIPRDSVKSEGPAWEPGLLVLFSSLIVPNGTKLMSHPNAAAMLLTWCGLWRFPPRRGLDSNCGVEAS